MFSQPTRAKTMDPRKSAPFLSSKIKTATDIKKYPLAFCDANILKYLTIKEWFVSDINNITENTGIYAVIIR